MSHTPRRYDSREAESTPMPPPRTSSAEIWRVLAYTLAHRAGLHRAGTAAARHLHAAGHGHAAAARGPARRRPGGAAGETSRRGGRSLARRAAAPATRPPHGHAAPGLRAGLHQPAGGQLRDVAARGAGRRAAARRTAAGCGATAGAVAGPGRGGCAAGAQPARVHRTGRALRGRRKRPGGARRAAAVALAPPPVPAGRAWWAARPRASKTAAGASRCRRPRRSAAMPCWPASPRRCGSR